MNHKAIILTLTAALFTIGCGSDDQSFNFGGPFPNPTSSPVVTGPTAVADTFSTLGNSVLTGSVTANDTLNGATVTAFQNPGNAGGTVAISAAGQLTYTPPLNAANVNDTFTYTLTNSAGASTATVTVQIQARGLFVKNDVAATGTGTQSNPFKTLHEAVLAAPVTGATIAIFRGDGTSTGLNTAETMPTNVTVQAVDSATPPLLTGPLTLTTNNRLQSLNFSATVPAAINGTNAANGTLTAVNVTTTGNKAAFLGNATGTWSILNSQFANANLGALDATCSTGTLDWTVQNCTFTNCRADIVGNLTAGGTAIQSLAVRNNLFNNGRDVVIGVRGLSTATNLTLTMTNNTVNGAGTALRGLDILVQNTCNVTASVKDNTITGCTAQGILLDVQGIANCAARFNNNRLTGNTVTQSLVAGNGGTAGLRVALDGNTADRYVIGGGGVPTFVENLATITTRNVGPFANSGVTDGPCPAP